MVNINNLVLCHFFTAGTPSAPTNVMVTSTATTSITLTWDQLGDPVDSYEINYDYSIDECGATLPTVTIEISNGSLRRYTITNSSQSPVEEDSTYMITLTAISNGTRITAPEIFVTTDEAGNRNDWSSYKNSDDNFFLQLLVPLSL